MLVEDLLVPALFASLAVGSAAGILAWRERPEPGATPLAVLLLGQCWWSASLLFRVQATGVEAKLFWTRIAWIGVIVIPLAWLVFVLEYTGRDRYVTPRIVGSLATVPLATVALVAIEPSQGLIDIAYYPPAGPGVGRVEQQGLWYWVTAVYTYILSAAGLGLIGTLLLGDSPVFRRQGAWLLGGVLPPWITNFLFLGGIIPTAIDPTPIAFSLSGVAYLIALTRHRLLGNTPAPNRRAREVLLEQFYHGAVVVDRNDYVSKVNKQCEQLLQIDTREALNAPAEEVLPEYDRLPEEGALENHVTIGQHTGSRSYDVVVTRITDVRGRYLGQVITFHEVTGYLRQQQRLRALNRILRHNIRTETNIICGYAEQLPEREETAIIRERASAIADLGEKGREAVELFEYAHQHTDPAPLKSLLKRCVQNSTDDIDDVEVTYHWAAAESEVSVPEMLETVFCQLIENAVEHTDAPRRIDIATAYEHGPGGDPQKATIRIADNGSGIDAYELEAIKEGTETPLEHGSGLGLWMARWGVGIVDGDLSFDTDDTGTTVTLTVPATTATASPGWETTSGRRPVVGT